MQQLAFLSVKCFMTARGRADPGPFELGLWMDLKLSEKSGTYPLGMSPAFLETSVLNH